MSFLKLLNNIRLDKAVSELLYSDKSVIKIAMDNGFPNLASFNRVFRESYQLTPAEYRKEASDKVDKQETEEITIISLRPESRAEVVLNRSFSNSSLIDKSFSI